MSKILVIGGAGYIGSHICKALAARGDVPVTFDNLSAGHAHAVKWGPLFIGDIRDETALHTAFADHRPDAVMHFAAHIEVGEGERAPLAFWDNNVAGVVSLLKVMEQAGIAPLVFSSTCAVYGEPLTLPIREDEPLKPVSVYGRTKKAVEDLLADAAKTGRMRFASLRYFNACGASPEGEIGEEHDPETHLIPNALKAAAGLGAAMKLFGDDYPTPDGTCVRDYIHVMDLADAHLKALDLLLAGHASFICNIGTGQGLSVREILDTVEAVTKRAVPHTIAARRPGDASKLVADTDRARALLQFEPKHSTAQQIITDAWRFYAPKWEIDTGVHATGEP